MRDDHLPEVEDETYLHDRSENDEVYHDDPSSGALMNHIAACAKPDSAGESSGGGGATAHSSQNRFALESLYFRSFRGTTLLTWKEEVALARSIDEGARRIKLALKHATTLLTTQIPIAYTRDLIEELTTIRWLSGLSAIVLDRAEALLAACLTSSSQIGAIFPWKPMTPWSPRSRLSDKPAVGWRPQKMSSCGITYASSSTSPNAIPPTASRCWTSYKKEISA